MARHHLINGIEVPFTAEEEANRDADHARREIVDTRNNLDSLIFATEKAMNEAGDKLPADKKTELESALKEAKEKLNSENLDELKAANERLQNVSHSMAQDMYGQAGAQPGAEGQAQGEEQQTSSEKKDDEDVVDADFKEV